MLHLLRVIMVDTAVMEPRRLVAEDAKVYFLRERCFAAFSFYTPLEHGYSHGNKLLFLKFQKKEND